MCGEWRGKIGNRAKRSRSWPGNKANNIANRRSASRRWFSSWPDRAFGWIWVLGSGSSSAKSGVCTTAYSEINFTTRSAHKWGAISMNLRWASDPQLIKWYMASFKPSCFSLIYHCFAKFAIDFRAWLSSKALIFSKYSNDTQFNGLLGVCSKVCFWLLSWLTGHSKKTHTNSNLRNSCI